MAYVLTPQDFSTSFLVFGPVLIHPVKYYTPRLSKVKDIFINRDAHENTKKHFKQQRERTDIFITSSSSAWPTCWSNAAMPVNNHGGRGGHPECKNFRYVSMTPLRPLQDAPQFQQ